MLKNYYLGCPIWGNKDWTGVFFTQKAKTKDYLRQYSQVFNTIEGNNTFYGLPKTETVLRWKHNTSEQFRFCFKFPRTISHDYKLNNVQAETTAFFKTLDPLMERIGIFFLQLPPSFNKMYLPVLAAFLKTLPQNLQYAVEVRHRDFFDKGKIEEHFISILKNTGVNLVMFDTITLHQIDSQDEGIIAAQRKKPNMPPRLLTTGKHPMLRFAGYPTVEPNTARLEILTDTVANWIEEGMHPYVFMHAAPSDFYAPHLCRLFHQMLAKKVKQIDIGTLPSWPFENEATLPKQLSLF